MVQFIKTTYIDINILYAIELLSDYVYEYLTLE